MEVNEKLRIINENWRKKKYKWERKEKKSEEEKTDITRQSKTVDNEKLMLFNITKLYAWHLMIGLRKREKKLKK